MMQGLYAVTTDRHVASSGLLDAVEQALIGGATVVQYRDKRAVDSTHENNLHGLRRLCKDYGSLLIVNDNVMLARKVNADGVHLGRDDLSLEAAREQLGAGKIIGVSCYADKVRAMQAVAAGADYIALGRFYSSATKPQAPPVTLERLREVRQVTDRPIVAIGGITAENGRPLVEAGADMLAAVEGIFGQEDITRAARQISALFLPEKNKDGL